MIDIVITMGGIGKRFRDVGYLIPKYMITAKDKTLFEWSLKSLDRLKGYINKYIFVALEDNSIDINEFISSKCELLGIDSFEILILDKLTDGQATTALMAKEYWDKNNELLIYNIDTYVESGEIKYEDFHGDGFIPCFKAPGNHWSFVRLDDSGKVVEIKEKERISDNCTIGAYYFSSSELYEKIYNRYYVELKNNGVGINNEKYIAPLYDYMINNDMEVYISDIPSDKVHVLGTPEELNDFINS